MQEEIIEVLGELEKNALLSFIYNLLLDEYKYCEKISKSLLSFLFIIILPRTTKKFAVKNHMLHKMFQYWQSCGTIDSGSNFLVKIKLLLKHMPLNWTR